MSETKTTARKASFDAKRAARLEERGVRIDNIVPANVAIGLEGVGEANCSLCDHDIKWLYVLHLGLNTGNTVTFEPVGSSCIQTWADSLPHSEAQQAILARLKVAEEEAEGIKASFREFNRQVDRGLLLPADRDALVRFLGSPPAIRSIGFLADVAKKVERHGGFASETQRKAWLGALNRELLKAKRPPLASVPASQGTLSAEDSALIKRAGLLLVFGPGTPERGLVQKLGQDRYDALKDIHSKVQQYGSFRSDAQRGFFASIIRQAEGGPREPTPPRGVAIPAGGRPIGGARPAAPPAPAAIEPKADDYDGELPF